MNYLAHVYLASQGPEAQLGALLGDFKGPRRPSTMDSVIERETTLHKMIDTFTDSHPSVLAAKASFGSDTRRFSGILLDIFFDHRLSCEWSNYAETELSQFTRQFYSNVGALSIYFPASLAEVFPRMVAEDWLGSYLEFDGVISAVDRVSRRLTKSGDAMRRGVEELEKQYVRMSGCFDLLFPDLVEHSRKQRASLSEHSGYKA